MPAGESYMGNELGVWPVSEPAQAVPVVEAPPKPIPVAPWRFMSGSLQAGSYGRGKWVRIRHDYSSDRIEVAQYRDERLIQRELRGDIYAALAVGEGVWFNG